MLTIVCRQCLVRPVEDSCPQCGSTLNPETLVKMHNDQKNGVPQDHRETPFIIMDG